MNKKRIFSVAYMFAITLAFTSVVSAIHLVNQDKIKTNERARLQGIVLEVLGIRAPAGSTRAQVSDLFDARVKTVQLEGRSVYVGLAADARTVIGYAFGVSGPGFWGPIFGMIGIDPKLERVLGIAFYDHGETPGLGGRITEHWFTAQFAGKRLEATGPGQRYFTLKRPGTSQGPNELDAITGASGTSNKLELFLNRNLGDTLPWLRAQQAKGVL
ncbi:MAG: hypothetical protein AUK55_13985 [Syntrophobacteraceae bacterium CG2_30_61_12]|nr:MAG: hypothetical protein AUK55_13985 [Syntrophobacteraceae bacterium CG2_30_61_12]